jgi:hypothetical protein
MHKAELFVLLVVSFPRMHLIKDTLLFPVIQAIHVVGLTVLVGTIALVDFRLLGFGIRRVSAWKLAGQLAPWTTGGLITMFVTGPLLFWSDWARYVKNPAFLVKMALLSIALAAHFTVHRRATRNAKWVAIVSLAAWSCVVLAGRAIADFDIAQ